MRTLPGLPWRGCVCPAGPGLRSRLAQPLDDGRVGHATALAHRLQHAPAAALFEMQLTGGGINDQMTGPGQG